MTMFCVYISFTENVASPNSVEMWHAERYLFVQLTHFGSLSAAMRMAVNCYACVRYCVNISLTKKVKLYSPDVTTKDSKFEPFLMMWVP